MANVNFLIAHISDLHFSEGTDTSNPDHSHSIKHLCGLQNRIPPSEEIDLLVLSGDISNYGDKQSLINASGYIFDQIPIGAGQYTGLHFPVGKTGIVPGNHDAWNATSSGTLIDRRQKSLENYNFAFPGHQIPGELGCYYDWLQKDDVAIYLAFVDSCFLGDTEENTSSTFGNVRIDQAVAKGQLTINQSETLLEWHDKGSKGLLENPRLKGSEIDKDVFARSLKVLVMHHYLFEPPEHSSDYFMKVHHRDVVFRNIALSDFDVLLCGHKHISAFDVHRYGAHFDRRATNRYLLNCFRRLIGLHSLPIQLEDGNGRRWSKALSIVANTLLKMIRRNKPTAGTTEIANEVLTMLKQGLDNPEQLERNVKKFLHEQGVSGAEILEGNELKDIRKQITINFSINQRKQLKQVADKIADTSKKLKNKPFLQVMSGSTAKASHDDKERAFNLYRIEHAAKTWLIKCERYTWDSNTNQFPNSFLVQQQSFDKTV